MPSILSAAKTHCEERMDLLEIITRLPKWDNDGSLPITGHVWSRAQLMYAESRQYVPQGQEPFAWPTGAGSVILSWVNKDRKFILEIDESSLKLSLKYVADAPYVLLTPSWAQCLRLLGQMYTSRAGDNPQAVSDVEELDEC